jgi:hypothetical protein
VYESEPEPPKLDEVGDDALLVDEVLVVQLWLEVVLWAGGEL